MSYDQQFTLVNEQEYNNHLKILEDELLRLRSHSCSIPIAKHFVPKLKPKHTDMMPSPMILNSKVDIRKTKTAQSKKYANSSKFTEHFENFYLSCPEDNNTNNCCTDDKIVCKLEKSDENLSKNSANSEIFNIRKKLFQNQNTLLEEESKYKEFDASQITTKKDLKPLVDYFKEFSESFFKEECDSSEFKLDEMSSVKRKSLNEYDLLKAKSELGFDNLNFKSRSNSILNALELDFNRRYSISLDC